VVIGAASAAGPAADPAAPVLITNGSILPASCGSFDLGSLTYRWRTIRLSTLQSIDVCSDERLKTNIVDLNYGLKEIMQLRSVRYNWKDSTNLGSKFEFGLIAQELDKIIPDLVYKPKADDENYSVSYMQFIPILIKGMQEQQDIIEAQQIQIDDLQSAKQKADKALNEIDVLKAENEALKQHLLRIDSFMEHLKQNVDKD
jgi:hypothetical protein